MNKNNHYCVFGGQYGSEGKGSVAEFLIRTRRNNGQKLIVIGDGGPNSGHTNTLVKTRQLPSCAAWADEVFLGPDSAIDPEVLQKDIASLIIATGKCPAIYIHENAAIVMSCHAMQEGAANLRDRIGSTQTGGGSARSAKYLMRDTACVVSSNIYRMPDHHALSVVGRSEWLDRVFGESEAGAMVIFECSQGVLLDTNQGRYPFVTSRSTIPSVSVGRNGLAALDWNMCGTYRCHPIRTGGETGPTGGKEIDWDMLMVKAEIATVTGRTRRVFDFSPADFAHSCRVAPPDEIFFTHCDYLLPFGDKISSFKHAFADKLHPIQEALTHISFSPSQFITLP